ncbi:hypothetical protein LSH36_691g00025, partial [Paralvinella palmiformis]
VESTKRNILEYNKRWTSAKCSLNKLCIGKGKPALFELLVCKEPLNKKLRPVTSQIEISSSEEVNNDQHIAKTSADIKACRLNHLAFLELLFSLVEHPLWKDVIGALRDGYYCLIYQALFGTLLDIVYDISDKI